MSLINRIFAKRLINVMKSEEFGKEIKSVVTDSPEEDNSNHFCVDRNTPIFEDSIREIPLIDLVRMCYYDSIASGKIPVLTYADGMIIHFYSDESKYIGDQKLVLWSIVKEIYYHKIGEYRRFIYFDDLSGTLEYIDSIGDRNLISGASAIIPIMMNHDPTVEAIVGKIKKIKK